MHYTIEILQLVIILLAPPFWMWSIVKVGNWMGLGK